MKKSLCILSRKNLTGINEHGDFQLEKPRPMELETLRHSGLPLKNLRDADATIIRTNPERTTRQQLHRLLTLESIARPTAIKLNPIASFQNYASKLATFNIWRNSGLATPDILSLPLWGFYHRYARELETLAKNGCYLRTSNEDSGKGLHFFPAYNEKAFKRAIWQLRARALTNKVPLADLLAVSAVNNRIDHIGYVYRTHLVGNLIVGGYATCADSDVIHTRNLSVANMQAFIAANSDLMGKLAEPAFSQQIVKALKSLNIHTAAVEFFIVNDQPVFLEVNPVWGGLHRFGDHEFQSALSNQRLPSNLELWLTPEIFYRQYWSAVSDLIEANGQYTEQAELVPQMQVQHNNSESS